MDGHHQHYTLRTPLNIATRLLRVSCGSPEDMGLVSQKPSMPEGNQGNTHRSNKYTGGQVAYAGLQGQHGPLTPRCKQPWAGWGRQIRLTPCRQGGAEKQHPRHVNLSQVPSKLRKRGAGFGGGATGGDLCPAPRLPKHGAPQWPGPAPALEEEDGDPQEEKVKEGPYPAGSGRGARRGVHQRPRRHRETRPRGAAPRVPRSGAAAARPAQRDPEGRRKDREEGRGRARGGAGPEGRRGAVPAGALRGIWTALS